MSRNQKGKTNLDFTEARDSEGQWHHLGHMQTICTSLQTDNHAGIDYFASALFNLVVIGLFFFSTVPRNLSRRYVSEMTRFASSGT